MIPLCVNCGRTRDRHPRTRCARFVSHYADIQPASPTQKFPVTLQEGWDHVTIQQYVVDVPRGQHLFDNSYSFICEMCGDGIGVIDGMEVLLHIRNLHRGVDTVTMWKASAYAARNRGVTVMDVNSLYPFETKVDIDTYHDLFVKAGELYHPGLKGMRWGDRVTLNSAGETVLTTLKSTAITNNKEKTMTNYRQKSPKVKAIFFDGTEKSAKVVIAWIAEMHRSAFYRAELPGWLDEEIPERHETIPAAIGILDEAEYGNTTRVCWLAADSYIYIEFDADGKPIKNVRDGDVQLKAGKKEDFEAKFETELV